ncbi:Rib/alpha-like domain-containing protein [Lactobacillus amylolyticus]|uniref:Rib/alpha-like domain-containing protein n=1 Tax=Lactobacillus amylolyticus TaxID=83683 RepID=UPI002491E0C2|nr:MULTISPECIES: Rib/alpha-like domain-containing protein [Lactobacillus]
MVTDADKYQPEVQTINGTTSQTLNDLMAKDGIKELIQQDDSTIPMAEPSNPTGNLRTTDTSAWAKVTYSDDSVDFVNIPLNITDVTPAPDIKTEADKYDPKGQNVETTIDNVPAASSAITNKNGDPVVPGVTNLPSDATYAWATTPDVSRAAIVPSIVTVTYGDCSQDQVPVNVIVKDASGNVPSTTGDVAKNDPQGKDVDTTIGVVPDPSQGVQWPSQPVDENGNPIDPSTITYTWSTTPDVYTQGAHPGVVQVTYPDGTSDLVTTTVNVTNAPSGKETTVPQGGTLPPASTVISWTDPQNPSVPTPSGATYTCTTSPDTNTPGNKTGVVTITYPNGEKTQVPVTVTPTDTTGSYDPYIDPQYYPYDPNGATPAVPTVNLPSGETAPDGVKYAWKTAPKTNEPGVQTSVVTATYTDANGKTATKDIPVLVTVGTMADYYKPSATDLTVPFNADMSNYSASAQISGVPAEVVSYDAWAPMPVTSVAGTQPTMIKVTYTDGSFDYVPLNVTVELADQAPDINKYQPEYEPATVAQGGTATATPTWSTEDGNQGAPAKHNSSASFASASDTPLWATVATDGTVTLKPGTDVNVGDYAIPVQVTYNNNSKETETVYVPVVVTGTNHSDIGDIVYGQNTQTTYTLNTFDTHKTNDDSPKATVTAPSVQKITFANQSYNKKTHQYNTESSVTYELQNGQYVATSVTVGGVTYDKDTDSDFATHSAEVDVHSGKAMASFADDAITTKWLTASDTYAAGVDRTPNTDATNFDKKGDGSKGSGTATSTAQSQYGDPEGDQRTTTGDNFPGNSKARVSITLSGNALTEFGSNPGWCMPSVTSTVLKLTKHLP